MKPRRILLMVIEDVCTLAVLIFIMLAMTDGLPGLMQTLGL